MYALDENLMPLKDAYRAVFPVGNVVSPNDINSHRFDILKKHFSILTAENAMKPLYLQREKGVFSFESADKMTDAVLAAGLAMHGHTLVWHQQSPEWMNREGISREEAVENLVTHIKTVAAHFRGRVISWDVLNEAFIDNPPSPGDWRASLRHSPWFKAIGPEYVELVFQAAREADPDAKLYYNDYNMDNQNKALAVYNMVKELNENYSVNGRPLIDGTGMQGHYRVNTNIDNVARSLERFISLGLEVSITELDVQAGANAVLSEAQSLEQGLALARLFALFKKHAANIGRVTIWGLDDGTSWRSQTNPTLFTRELITKPAFYAALDPAAFIAQNESKLVKECKQADAVYGSPPLDSTVSPLWDRAPVIPVDQYLMAWQGASGTAQVLWDEDALYVRLQAQNAALNKANPAAYEQDSVEIFIDEGNHKLPYLQDGDGQYRVNFDNERTCSPLSFMEGFQSAASVAPNAYTVVMKIPFKTIQPAENTLIGFEAQINGASERGIRQSVAVWNDVSGNSFQDTSGYGVLRLVK
jgi:endo-1,4-beta-xylanase